MSDSFEVETPGGKIVISMTAAEPVGSAEITEENREAIRELREAGKAGLTAASALLKDRSLAVQRAALEIIRACGEDARSVLGPMIEALSDNFPPFPYEVAKVIAGIGPAAIPDLIRAGVTRIGIQGPVAAALCSIGEPALGPVLELLDGSAEEVGFAANALGQFIKLRPDLNSAALIRSVIRTLPQGDEYARYCFILGLGRSKIERPLIVEALVGCLNDSPLRIALAAVDALKEFRADAAAAIPHLRARMFSDGKGRLECGRTLFALCTIDKENAPVYLREYVEGTGTLDDGYLYVVGFMGLRGGEALTRYLDHENAELRRLAAKKYRESVEFPASAFFADRLVAHFESKDLKIALESVKSFEAVAKRAAGAPELLAGGRADDGSAIADVYARTRKAAVESLTKLKSHKSVQMQKAVARALKTLGVV